ncbi:hypothetical protein [Methylocapsa aurea]|uniref:hypothetical protein n=1 Tax=Methylocapsa aurea TaxID=663610 RepID=UPI00068D91EB|nr:hypothetical protein [Methylocapsa aurea]
MTAMPGEFAAHSLEAAAASASGREISMSVPRQDAFAKPDSPARQGQSAAMSEAFVKTIERIERLLDLETEMLKQHRPIVLHDFNHKKSHGLLELTRTMDALRALDDPAVDFDVRAPLARLRVKLESNLAMLQMHLNAVGEIAEIIARAIQDHESDGTYSAGMNGIGYRR